jgi:hypothetical protein
LANFTKPFFQSGLGFWMTFPEFSYWFLRDDAHDFLKIDQSTVFHPGRQYLLLDNAFLPAPPIVLQCASVAARDAVDFPSALDNSCQPI